MATTVIASDALPRRRDRGAPGRVAVNRPSNGSSASPSTTSRVADARRGAPSRDAVSRAPASRCSGRGACRRSSRARRCPGRARCGACRRARRGAVTGRSSGTNGPDEHLVVRHRAPQRVDADREIEVVLRLASVEPRVERLRARREREGHVGVALRSAAACRPSRPVGAELATTSGRTCRRARAPGRRRAATPTRRRAGSAPRDEVDDHDVGDEARRRCVSSASRSCTSSGYTPFAARRMLRFESGAATMRSADRRRAGSRRARGRAAVRVGGNVGSSPSVASNALRDDDAVVHGEREVQAVDVAARRDQCPS